MKSFFNFRKRDLLLATALTGTTLSHAPITFAQTDTVEEDVIIVTGSYIKRADPADSASPLSIVDRETFENLGIANPIDFVRFLTINTGSEFNPDIFTVGGTAGTSQYNLRGLGLGSTLVLLNGRRSVGAGSNASFVDINTLLPQIAVDRVEILKDGASSLYGSDAVAGVVNHITRDDFVGAEVLFDYRNGQSDQRTLQGDAIFGGEFGPKDTNVVLSLSYVDQTRLLASEQDFATVQSGIGSPGSFFLLDAAGAVIPQAPFPLADPNCVAGGGIPAFNPATGIGTCNFDLSPFTDLQTDDERFLAMLTVRHDINENHEFFLDLNYSTRETLRSGSPSFPGLRLITVPLDHPNIGDAPTLFGTPATAVPGVDQLRFFGRPLGNGFDPVDSVLSDDYYRVSGGFRGDLNETWSYEAGITYSRDDFLDSTRSDVLADVFQGAINDGTFNPFGSALTGAAPNDPAVIASFRANNEREVDAELFTLDGVISGEFGSLPGGSIGVAVGGQYRKNSRRSDSNDLSNAGAFFFTVGQGDSDASQDVVAAFVETIVPVSENIEIQGALRYEDVDGIGDSIDPKIAILAKPIDQLSLRASYSTSFRAPTVAQLFEENVGVGPIFDPLSPAGAGVVFVPNRFLGDPNLEPEEAENFNIGGTWKPTSNLTFNADYWNFDYDNLITQASTQGIVLANAANPALFSDQITRTNGFLEEVAGGNINAPSLETDGLDFGVNFQSTIPNSEIDWGISAEATHILSYDIQESADGPVIDAAGARNRTNIGAATPEWRGNATLLVSNSFAKASVTGRYIDSFINDEGANPGETIDDFITVDGQVSFNIPTINLGNKEVEPTVTIGATNIFNEEPPFADTTNAFPFATRVHDPRGRIVYVRTGLKF